MFFYIILIKSFSATGMQPDEYDFDSSGCLRCLDRVILKSCVFYISYLNPTIDNKVFIASFRGNSKDLISALKAGGNINFQQAPGGWTALHYVAHNAPLQHLKMLLDNGANPNITDDDGNTPCHSAIEGGNTPGVALLIQYGAQLDYKNENQLTAYALAKKLKHSNCMKVIGDAPLLRQLAQEENNPTPLIKEKAPLLVAVKKTMHVRTHVEDTHKKNHSPAINTHLPIFVPILTPQEIALQNQQAHQELIEKQAIEKELARVKAKHKEAYQQEFLAGKQQAREKHKLLKNTKH